MVKTKFRHRLGVHIYLVSDRDFGSSFLCDPRRVTRPSWGIVSLTTNRAAVPTS